MRKRVWIPLTILLIFVGIMVLAVLVATFVESPTDKIVKPVQKPAVVKPKPKPAVTKPKPKPAKPKYTARQVYDFVLQYEIHREGSGLGYTVGATTDLMCELMKAQGDKVDITDGKAWLVKGDIWRVSYVVVINDSEFHTFEFEADMARKTVKPISKMARDIWSK